MSAFILSDSKVSESISMWVLGPMVVIGMGFWIAAEALARSKWNLFLNPFRVPDQLTEAAWSGIIYQNRIMLAVGSVIAILWGLYNLQKREKFI